MSLSHRTARAARVIGTSVAAAALALGAAHTALACSISDFSAATGCDTNGNGVIRVTDKDASGTPATITVYMKLTQPFDNERLVGTKTIEHPTAQGTTVEFVPLDWYAGEQFRIHVKAGDRVDDDIRPLLVVPDETCKPSGPSPSAPATPSAQPSSASEHPSPTPSAAPTTRPGSTQSSSPAAAPGASSAPSPAGAGSDLAETGASSSTPVIAGIAAALVIAGIGTLLALRRRAAHRSH